MTFPQTPIAIEDLLAHQAWVQQLARTLVEDAASADDLIQDAWMAALRHPPRDGRSLRGWLATVLRNLARNRRRDAYRRDRHELGAASASTASKDTVTTAADLVARADLGATVTRAVTALPEPYRATILRRYFDNLSPSEIARVTGAPIDTVKSRLKRGLALLRESLRDGDDDRRAWALALFPLAALSTTGNTTPPRSSSPTPLGLPLGGSAISATTKTVAMVAAVLLIALAWNVMAPDLGQPGDTEHATEATGREGGPETRTREHVATDTAGMASSDSPTDPTATGIIVVGVKSTDDKPIPNATVRVWPWRTKIAGAPVAQRVGHLETERDDVTAEVECDANGAATITGVPPGTYELDVRAEGRAGEWPRVTIREGVTVELTVLLQESVELACRVIDVSGRSVEGASVVVAPIGADERSTAARLVSLTDADGRCTVRGLARGRHFVRVRTSASVTWSGGTVDAGAVRRHVVRLGATGTLTGRIVSGPADSPVAGAIVGVRVEEPFDALSRDRARFGAETETTTDVTGAFRIDGLPLASVTVVTVHASDYVPYVEHTFPIFAPRVEPGDGPSLDVTLTRTGSLRGTVADGAGEPIEGARVLASTRGRSNSVAGRTSAVLSGGDGTFVLTNVVPGNVTVTAGAHGYFAPKPTTIELAPGSTAQVSVTLLRGGTVAGVVRDEAGEPVSEATVYIAPASRPIGGPSAVTDRDGAFRVEGVRPGEALVATASSPRGFGQSARFTIEGRATIGDIGIVVADKRGSIEGVVVRADGRPVGGTRVRVTRGTIDLAQPWFRQTSDQVVGSNGAFRFPALGRGTFTLAAWLPGLPVATGGPIRLADRANVTGVRIELPLAAEIHGRVLDAEGRPLMGAAIAHMADGWPQPGDVSAITDAAGGFTIGGVRPGAFNLVVIAAGYVEARMEAVAGGGEALVTLRRGAAIEGRIETKDGSTPAPVPNWVFVTGENSRSWAHVAVRRDGSFRTFPLDPEETYSLYAFYAPAQKGGHDYLSDLTENVRTGATNVVVRMLATARITGRVVDRRGVSVGKGVPVTGLTRGETVGTRGAQWSTRTTTDGSFEAVALSGKRYGIIAGGYGSDFVPRVAADDVGAGTTSLALTVRRGVTIAGRVVGADGSGVKGVSVGVTFDGDALASSLQRALAGARGGDTTDASGRFSLRGVPRGPVELRVYHADTRAWVRVGSHTAPSDNVEIRLPE